MDLGHSPDTREQLNAWLDREGFERRGDVVISGRLALHGGGRVTEVKPVETAVLVGIGINPHTGLALDRFRKNPVVLFAHDYDGLPVARGLWERVRPAPDESRLGVLMAKVQFHRDTVLSREVWRLVRAGLIDRVSVGYLPTRWSSKGGAFRQEAADLVEISFVLNPEQLDAYRKQHVTAPALCKAISALDAEVADLIDDPAPLPDKPDAYEEATRGLSVIEFEVYQRDLKRYARAALMMGILPRSEFAYRDTDGTLTSRIPASVAEVAFDFAEAMLAEQKKRLEAARGDS